MHLDCRSVVCNPVWAGVGGRHSFLEEREVGLATHPPSRKEELLTDTGVATSEEAT
jgi:hypothetical protein